MITLKDNGDTITLEMGRGMAVIVLAAYIMREKQLAKDEVDPKQKYHAATRLTDGIDALTKIETDNEYQDELIRRALEGLEQ